MGASASVEIKRRVELGLFDAPGFHTAEPFVDDTFDYVMSLYGLPSSFIDGNNNCNNNDDDDGEDQDDGDDNNDDNEEEEEEEEEENDIIWLRPRQIYRGTGKLFPINKDPHPSDIVYTFKDQCDDLGDYHDITNNSDFNNSDNRSNSVNKSNNGSNLHQHHHHHHHQVSFYSECNFTHILSVLRTLSRRPDYIQKLFLFYNSTAGCAAVKLWHNSKDEIVIIDDLIPCHRSTRRPIIAYSSQGDCWIPLLLKAMSKLHGSYKKAFYTHADTTTDSHADSHEQTSIIDSYNVPMSNNATGGKDGDSYKTSKSSSENHQERNVIGNHDNINDDDNGDDDNTGNIWRGVSTTARELLADITGEIVITDNVIHCRNIDTNDGNSSGYNNDSNGFTNNDSMMKMMRNPKQIQLLSQQYESIIQQFELVMNRLKEGMTLIICSRSSNHQHHHQYHRNNYKGSIGDKKGKSYAITNCDNFNIHSMSTDMVKDLDSGEMFFNLSPALSSFNQVFLMNKVSNSNSNAHSHSNSYHNVDNYYRRKTPFYGRVHIWSDDENIGKWMFWIDFITLINEIHFCRLNVLMFGSGSSLKSPKETICLQGKWAYNNNDARKNNNSIGNSSDITAAAGGDDGGDGDNDDESNGIEINKCGGGDHLPTWHMNPVYRLTLPQLDSSLKSIGGGGGGGGGGKKKHMQKVRLLVNLSVPDQRYLVNDDDDDDGSRTNGLGNINQKASNIINSDIISDKKIKIKNKNKNNTLCQYPAIGLSIAKDNITMKNILYRTSYSNSRDVSVEISLNEVLDIELPTSLLIIPSTYQSNVVSDFYISCRLFFYPGFENAPVPKLEYLSYYDDLKYSIQIYNNLSSNTGNKNHGSENGKSYIGDCEWKSGENSFGKISVQKESLEKATFWRVRLALTKPSTAIATQTATTSKTNNANTSLKSYIGNVKGGDRDRDRESRGERDDSMRRSNGTISEPQKSKQQRQHHNNSSGKNDINTNKDFNHHDDDDSGLEDEGPKLVKLCVFLGNTRKKQIITDKIDSTDKENENQNKFDNDIDDNDDGSLKEYEELMRPLEIDTLTPHEFLLKYRVSRQKLLDSSSSPPLLSTGTYILKEYTIGRLLHYYNIEAPMSMFAKGRGDMYSKNDDDEIINALLHPRTNRDACGQFGFEKSPITVRYFEEFLSADKVKVMPMPVSNDIDGDDDDEDDDEDEDDDDDSNGNNDADSDKDNPNENGKEIKNSRTIKNQSNQIQNVSSSSSSSSSFQLTQSSMPTFTPGGDKYIDYYLMPCSYAEGDEGSYSLTVCSNRRIISIDKIERIDQVISPCEENENYTFKIGNFTDDNGNDGDKSNKKKNAFKPMQIRPSKSQLLTTIKATCLRDDEYERKGRRHRSNTSHKIKREVKEAQDRNDFNYTRPDDNLIKLRESGSKFFKDELKIKMKEIEEKYFPTV